MTGKKVHVIINPASGSREAVRYYNETVKPYIRNLAQDVEIVEHVTKSEGDAGNIAEQIVKSSSVEEADIYVAILGGDGTTHELLSGLVQRTPGEALGVTQRVKLALIPTGTANALYASLYAHSDEPGEDKLRSLKALLTNSGEPLPLALALVTASTSDGEDRALIAHLITSHALHASILADSESLRAEYPGIERFKMAFKQNMTKWVPAGITLRPLQSGDKQGQVLRYEVSTGTFQAIAPSETEIEDFVSYFACLSTDRLEPEFVPAPLSGPFCERSELKRPADAVDVLIFRPLRNPALASLHAKKQADKNFWLGEESEETRKKIAESHLVEISTQMYQQGKHIDLTYSEGDELQMNGDGLAVCEYYRCAGYAWKPLHQSSRRVCVDGTVLQADRVEVRVLSREEGAGRVQVYH